MSSLRNLQLGQSSVDVRVWRSDDTVLLDTLGQMAMFEFRLFGRMPVLAFSAEVSSFARTPQYEVIY
jgi:hypothetical protein